MFSVERIGWFISLNLLSGVNCFKFQVKIDGKNVDLEIPGLETPSLLNETSYYNNAYDTDENVLNWETLRRYKRHGSAPYDRTGPKCEERLSMMQKGSSNMAIQYSVLIENKQTAKMTCHFCGDPASEEFEAMNWFRLQRNENDGVYKFSEVGLDMHDNEDDNRIYKTVDHTLIVKKATEDDAGSYLCHDFSTADRLYKKDMSQEDIETILSATDKFRFFYHLDVLRPSKIPVVEVSKSETSILKRKPRPPEVREDMNFKLITEWQKWSRCSVCGKAGERKRLGICIVKKDNVDLQCFPWYLESVLASSPTGVPCRSSVFKNHVILKTRPDELLRGKCNIKCSAVYTEHGKAMSISGLKDVLFGKKKKGMKKKKLKVEVGTELHLICPDVQLDTVVIWLNNTRPIVDVEISKLTNGRVEVDAHNVLRIHKVLITDAGKYQCIKEYEEQIEFIVIVFIDKKGDFWEYTGYLVLTYPVNFAFFLIFLIVKHRRHKVGVQLTDEQLKLLDDLSSSPSLATNAKDDGSGSEDELRNGDSSSTD